MFVGTGRSAAGRNTCILQVGDEFLGIGGGTYNISKDFIITHPNDKGMREIAEIIYGGIEELVSGKIGAK